MIGTLSDRGRQASQRAADPNPHTQRRARPHLTAPAVASVAAATLILAACSSTPDSQVASLSGSQSDPTASAPSRTDDGGLAFARCMRENGVDFPDPDPDGGFGGGPPPGIERGNEQFATALQACQDLRPAGGRGDRILDEAAQQAALALAKCMREAGFDFADPQFDANGNRIADADRDRSQFRDPQFRDAMQTCREESGIEGRPGPGGPA